jgi:hypothetical protein
MYTLRKRQKVEIESTITTTTTIIIALIIIARVDTIEREALHQNVVVKDARMKFSIWNMKRANNIRNIQATKENLPSKVKIINMILSCLLRTMMTL